MNKMLVGFMILSLGVALGRMFDGVPATAAAIGHQGGGALL